MLIRITWGLVLAGLGLVIAGFLNDDSNVLLILAIAAEIAAIVLVLASWARRAKEATALGIEEGVPVDSGRDEPEEEELYAALEEDEELAVTTRRRTRQTKSPARRKAASTTPARKAKAKPAAPRKSTAKSTAKSAAKSSAKPAAKRKPAARKAKPKAQPSSTTGPKAKAPRRRPPTPSE